MIETPLEFVSGAVAAIAPWLDGAAVAALALSLVLLCARDGRFAGLRRRFSGLALPAKLAILAVAVLATRRAGSKEGANLPSAISGGTASAGASATSALPPAPPPEGIAGNGIAITAFEASPTNQTLAFEATWTTNLFDYTASRDLYLLQSTNLLERRWAPLGAYTMPVGTNSHAFTVAEADVDAAMRPLFLDAFSGGMAFYRLGIDFDSDGDGIADPIERYWLFTDEDAADTDGDGLADSEELSVGTDPIDPDPDGDGLPDGMEVLAILETAFLPWLELTAATNLTAALDGAGYEGVSLPLPAPVGILQATATNIVVYADGMAEFRLAPGTNSMPACGGVLDYPSYFWVYPCYCWLDPAGYGSQTNVLFGTAAVGQDCYHVLQWTMQHVHRNSGATNSFSCQMAFPTGRVDRISVRFADCVGEAVDGRSSYVAMYGPGNGWAQYCNFERGKIWDGLGLTFLVGYGSSPSSTDTDGDGLSDGEEVSIHVTDPCSADTDWDGLADPQELSIGTCPSAWDTDGDGLADGWETGYGFDPLSAAGSDGAFGDPDNDGLANILEQELWTDPRVADTDGDGLDDGTEAQSGSDPILADTDGDGLPDGAESAHGTNPLYADTDGDGLLDGWEAAHGLDPLSTSGADGANGDPDGDGLTNLQEQAIGSDPHSVDTDGDGLTDPQEAQLGTSPALADTDGDGLSDPQEIGLGLNPRQPDSDSDGMDDGWEHRYRNLGFDPATDNATDANPANDFGADPDADGLANGEECASGTNPGAADTDGDGVDDGTEAGQGSDPCDPSDGGVPGSRVPVPFVFGDPSGSESEKYRLSIVPVAGEGSTPGSFSWLNQHYGQCETRTAMLKRGWKYEVRLFHAGTCGTGHGYPDYDYQLDFGGDKPPYGVIADDPGRLFGDDYTSDRFAASGKAAYLYVLMPPKLVPDYDRDGDIDSDDEAVYDEGATTFRFWVNDDEDSDATDGKYAESPEVDIPGAVAGWFEFDGRDPDWDNGEVDGWRDLIDFTPVHMDVSTVRMLPATIRSNLTFRLRQADGAANAVWTGLAKSQVGQFQRGEVDSCGRNLDEDSYEATSERVKATGTAVPSALADRMKFGADGSGVAFIEGRAASASPLLLDILAPGRAQPVVTGVLPMRLSSVEEMYRWLNARGLSGESVQFPSRPGEPSNMPDVETSDRNLVFFHGANVTQDGSRGWAAEIFKRMWQSGMTAKFTAVTWRSDIGSSANYQENVSNAFFTASAIFPAVTNLPGTKVLMAHSLGNVVCSSMIQDYGLEPDVYLMCNSAVPSEAYYPANDISIRVPQLVHPDWEEYPTNSWASNWHKLFGSDVNDDRRKLGWPGRFIDVVPYAVNFYSTGDEVLELLPDNNVYIWTGITSGYVQYSWHHQELWKGRTVANMLGGTTWSGWNIEENLFGANKISVAEALLMSDEDFKTNTVFYCYPSSMNSTNIGLLVRGAHLAQGIPALTPPTGRTDTSELLDQESSFNLDLTNPGIDHPNDWPNISSFPNRWRHSDMKDVAYFFNYTFYEKAIEKGDLQ